MSTLAQIRDRCEQQLADTGNAIWSTFWVDEGIRQALAEYSWQMPRRLITTVTLSADAWEIDISSISGVLFVQRVWLPYTASAPEDPPEWRGFEWWKDSNLLLVTTGEQPASGDVARIFYGAAQTIQDLDSASATTIPVPDESLIVAGAIGFAVLSRGLDVKEQVTLGRRDSEQLRAWGNERLLEFRTALARRAGQEAARSWGHVAIPALDRWDRSWS